MPFFTFSLKKNFLIKNQLLDIDISDIKKNSTYFSKNTKLWKYLNKKKFLDDINFISFKKREHINGVQEPILFCLPPSLGLGDVIEYSLSIQNLINNKLFTKVGIAFVGRYKFVLNKYFKIPHVYRDTINELDFKKYKTIFHLTLELDELRMQKYIRVDIETSLNNFFKIKAKKIISNKSVPIKKINIFPISSSPIRTMSPEILNSLILFYENKYQLEIVLDNSNISNFLESKLIKGKFILSKPKNIEELCDNIENSEFGIFMDSGPLHLAKLLRKKGILIITSVSQDILLKDADAIIAINNEFTSNYCSAPCGLTNTFNYLGKSGCFESLKLKKNDFLKIKNTNSLQRGRNKDLYIDLLSKPVGCIRKINIKMLLKSINTSLLN